MTSTVSSISKPLPRSAQKRAGASYRHNPYAVALLLDKDSERATDSFSYIYSVLSKEESLDSLPTHKSFAMMTAGSASRYSSACPTPQLQPLDGAKAAAAGGADSSNDDGVSETSSDFGSHTVKDALASASAGFSVTGSHLPRASAPAAAVTAAAAAAPSAAAPSVIRYASVNFRFGSAWFVAPFRTFVGDMVVVQYPGNNSLHMGLVSAITTAKPITFYTEDNMDSNYLSPEELQSAPRLLRHARDFDKETKLDLRNHDLNALANARKLAAELGVPVQFLDAEWLLDLSAVTFLVKVFGNTNLVDKLVDELAMQEGAEVVFTYPVSSAAMYQ